MRLHNNQFRSKEYSRKLNDLVEEIMVEEFLHKIKELKQNYNNLENFRDALLQDYKKIIKYLDKWFCYNFKYDYDTAIVRDNSIGIVTHRDGDGICSTALLLRKCHNINAYFIKHNEINLIKNIKNKKIYIVDIRINGYIADYVNSLIKE
jgi:oligoribonuclease NrnB/cAMP/cGMP phosphodiesterase (DHH superfamily)